MVEVIDAATRSTSITLETGHIKMDDAISSSNKQQVCYKC